ncbi:MAG TPA: hypothetical protein VNP73_09085 [Actinomycetota bacterium]|nr:hypothetical protein [Actinomycetota bacterium]
MRTHRRGLAVVVVALIGLIAAPAGAAGTPVVMSQPASRETTYTTPVVVIQPGEDVTFVNTDLFPHDVRSVLMGPDNTSWCKPADPDEPQHRVRNPRRFPIGKCPLLWTPPIGMTNGVLESKLYGTDNVTSGTTVDFYCTVFPNMTGKVIVL